MPVIVSSGQTHTVIVERQRTATSTVRATSTVSIPDMGANVGTVTRVASVIGVASTGIQGPPGQDGGAYITKFAASALGGHRIVRAVSATEVDYASSDTADHGDDVLGMTLGAAGLGDVVLVANDQDITEPSWAWTPQAPLYLATNGQITQTPPDAPAAFALIVGFATSATSARIRIETPVFL